MIFQNITERPLNMTSFPNNFKSFIKEVSKNWTVRKIFKKKKHQNNHFGAKIGQKEKQLLRRKVKKKIDF